ncbi:MAG: O-antigen ligase family protein [Prevotella sp.]|nr:O-antigen ligase family protein [Prevotella sp.]
MQLSIENIVKFFFCFLIFLLAECCGYNMIMMEGGYLDVGLGRYVIALTFMLWGGAVAIFMLPGVNFYKPPFTVTAFLAYFFWVIIPTTILTTRSGDSLTFNIIGAWMPLLVLLLSYNIARNYGHNRWFLIMFLAIGAICTRQYFKIFFNFNAIAEESHLISSYYLLYILPLMMLCKSKTLRLTLSLLVLIMILISFKRAGIVALVLGLITYVVSMQFVTNRIKPSSILAGLIIGALFAFVIIMLGNMGEETLFERFENIGNDNGSGRTVVWAITAKMIEDSDLSSLLFGHGYNAVVQNSPINLSAHNDFLEITYDYGIIGITLYLSAFISLCYYVVKMLREKSEYAPSMAMLTSIMFVLSMISHIAIYYWMNVVMLTVGYCIGNFKRNKYLLIPQETNALNE